MMRIAPTEDFEDFEQEKTIREWLEQQGITDGFDFKYTSSKGTTRNTLVRASVRLEQKIGFEERSGTYADIIAGSDGRDLYDRGPDIDSRAEAKNQIHATLSSLGFTLVEVNWLETILMLSVRVDQRRLTRLARSLVL